MNKGIELPINILVIVAVAIIVLLGVIALFYSSWFGGTGQISAETAKANACNRASREGLCTTDTDTLPVTYKTYTNLDEFCQGEYGTTDDADANCLRLACGMQC